MSHSLDREIRSTIADALSREAGVLFDVTGIRLPSKNSAASVHLPLRSATRNFPADLFPHVFDVPLVSDTRAVGGWLLIDFCDSFYDALVGRILAELPVVSGETEIHAISKLLSLARHGGSGCPRIPSLQRALLLALVAQRSPGAFSLACHACETMLYPVPARERPALIVQCGELADSLARLLLSAGQSTCAM